jgi:biofilm protein TabA
MHKAPISEAKNYVDLHPLFATAFSFLSTVDTNSLVPGEVKVADGVRAIIIKDHLVGKEISIAAFECHEQNIDIQYVIAGEEGVGYRERSTCISPQAPYNPEKDVLFFNDAPDQYFTLKAQEFAIYFPNDVHAPMIGDPSTEIFKIVVKVAV